METTTTATPRVWVGCLACYNAGRLMGEWVDATEAGDLSRERVHGSSATLALVEVQDGGSPHEELWCFDLEGFGGFLEGECSPSEAQAVAEVIAAIEADGTDLGAVGAWASYEHGRVEEWDAPTREAFEEAYCGEWKSGADYAENLAEDIGALDSADARWPLTCIDWERAWNELRLGDGYYEVPTGAPAYEFYIFRGV